MKTVAFHLAVGCAFILFGRWAYRNPRKILGETFLSNPQNSWTDRIARVWSLLVILCGSYTILITATARLAKGLGGAFLGLGLSVPLVWYLRPRLPKAGQSRTAPQGPRGTLTAAGKRFMWITLIATTAATITTIAFVILHVSLVPLVPAEALGMAALILILLRRQGPAG